MQKSSFESILSQRRAGVLLHPSSLPGKQKIGDIGEQARNFLHFMSDCGLSVWQMLPLGPTHIDGSPYQCLSAHAGNTELINLDWLVKQGWLTPHEIETLDNVDTTLPLLDIAEERFFKGAEYLWQSRFEKFIGQASYWLPDYSLFIALKTAQLNEPWMNWPERYRFRDPEALREAAIEHAATIKKIQFGQFVFFTQWHELRDYASSLNIKLFGDMPIYVSMDSADAWSKKENFLIHKDGSCDFVAGVPPDAFSEDGQLWGNPLYDWKYLKKHDFSWWINRFKTQLELFDLIRIDHFRGLQACWHVPADAKTAQQGQWVKTPGAELLDCLHDYFESLPLVAEDLGFITAEVKHLRDHFKLPGMAVLQFAFDGQADNPYLPHNHKHNSVVYTGTHDNDTTSGWYQKLPGYMKKQLHDYMGHSEFSSLDMPWTLNRMALASVANLAIIPMQDLLNLDSSHRMNTPGTTQGNWHWRFDWSSLWPDLPKDLQHLIRLYGREAINSE